MDAVIHFAAIAYVGESVANPLQYYHNITINTVMLLETMKRFDVRKLVYSSTCATYGNPEKLPITERTPTVPINPYGDRSSAITAESPARASTPPSGSSQSSSSWARISRRGTGRA